MMALLFSVELIRNYIVRFNIRLKIKKLLFLPLVFILNTVTADTSLENYLINDFDVSIDAYQSNEYPKSFEQTPPKTLINKLSNDKSYLIRDLESFAVIDAYDKDKFYNKTNELLPIDFIISGLNEDDSFISNNKIIIKNLSNFTNPISVKTKPPKYNKFYSLSSYDQLWIDYNNKGNEMLCDLSSQITLKGKSWPNKNNVKINEKWVSFNNFSHSEIILTDITESKWKEKDSWYTISGLIGLKSDFYWRYSSYKENIVAQRRMDWQMSRSSSLTIEYSGELNGINIRVSFDGSKVGGELIEIPLSTLIDIPRTKSSDDKFSIIDLKIGHYIAKSFTDKMIELPNGELGKKVHLNEIIIHLKDNGKKLLPTEIVKSIILMENKKYSSDNMAITNLVKTKSINLSNATWKKINFLNNIQEYFVGSEDQKGWYWKQEKKNTEIDKILNWKLRANSKLAVFVDEDTFDDEIAVSSISFQFATKNEKGLIKTIDNPKVTKLFDGRFAILFELDELLIDHINHFKNEEGISSQPILKSINLLIDGNFFDILHNNVLQEVAIYEKDDSKNFKNNYELYDQINFINLMSYSKKIGFEKYRHIIDLSSLAKIGDLSLDDFLLYLNRPENDLICSFDIDSIQLALNGKIRKPSYIHQVEKLNEKYGLKFLHNFQPKFTEVVKFLAYTSPSLFHKKDHESNTNKVVQSVDNFEGIADKILFSVDGIKLSSSGDTIITKPYFRKNSNKSSGVQIKGNGKNVTLLWPIKTKIDEKSFFYLSVPENKEKISKVLLTIKNKDGKQWKNLININTPIFLKDIPKEIDSVEIALTFNKFFDFVLGEMAIATPKMLNNEDILFSDIPANNSQSLQIKSLSEGIKKLSDTKSFWSENIDNGSIETVVQNPMTWLEKIIIDFQIPNNWLIDNSCVLKGDFIYTNQKITRSFCLSQSTYSISLTAGELGLLKQKNLEKIVWHIKKPLDVSGIVKLDTKINSWGISTMYNQIKYTPLFYLDKKPYYLNANDIEKVSNLKQFKFKLPSDFLNDFVKNSNKFKINSNSWFKLDRISLEPGDTLNWYDWVKLTEPIQIEKNHNWLVKLISFIFFICLFIFLITKYNLKKLYIPKKNTIKSLNIKFFDLITNIYTFVENISRWLNLFVGILFMVILFYLFLTLNHNMNAQYIFFASIILLSFHIFRFWRQFGLISKRLDKPLWPNFTFYLFILSIILFLVLALMHNFDIKWYSIIPVVVSFYGLLPEFLKYTSSTYKSSHYLYKLIIWLVIALILYLNGITSILDNKESYSLSFAGISMVIVWRYLVNYLRPIIESDWPIINKKLYAESSSKYFIGFAVTLVGAVLMFLFSFSIIGLAILENFAIQFAVIGYFMLIVAVVLKSINLMKFKPSIKEKNSS